MYYRPVIVVLVVTLVAGPVVGHSEDPDAPHRKPEYRYVHDETLKISMNTALFTSATSQGPGPTIFWG